MLYVYIYICFIISKIKFFIILYHSGIILDNIENIKNITYDIYIYIYIYIYI